MKDMKQELRKLDPSKLVDRLYEDGDLPLPSIMTIHEWDSLREIPLRELSKHYLKMIRVAPNVPFEVTGRDEHGRESKVWCIVPTRGPVAIQQVMDISSMIRGEEEIRGRYFIEGEILPENTDLVPEGVTAILGNFYQYETA